jgi:hypothetical protein
MYLITFYKLKGIMETKKCDKYIQRLIQHMNSMNSVFMNKKQIAIFELLIKDYRQCMERYSK